MDTGFLQLITDQAGTMLLALVMIWIMKAWHEASVKRADERAVTQAASHELELARLQQQSNEHRDDKDMLADVIRANTESNMKLIAAVEKLESVIHDRVGYVIAKEQPKEK